MLLCAGKAQYRWSRLTSNVRPRKLGQCIAGAVNRRSLCCPAHRPSLPPSPPTTSFVARLGAGRGIRLRSAHHSSPSTLCAAPSSDWHMPQHLRWLPSASPLAQVNRCMALGKHGSATSASSCKINKNVSAATTVPLQASRSISAKLQPRGRSRHVEHRHINANLRRNANSEA